MTLKYVKQLYVLKGGFQNSWPFQKTVLFARQCNLTENKTIKKMPVHSFQVYRFLI